MAHHFKFNGIFVPIITSYLDPEECSIIFDYCDIQKMTPRDEIWRVTEYCVKHDLRDYLQYFIERTSAPLILYHAAGYHNRYFRDLAIARGAKHFDQAFVQSIRTGDLEWITFFKDKCDDNYENVIVEAIRLNNHLLTKIIWDWDIDASIPTDSVIRTLGQCIDPISILAPFIGELAYVEGQDNDAGIIPIVWDHLTQSAMIHVLTELGYDLSRWYDGIIQSGNIAAIALIHDITEMDFDLVEKLAEKYNQQAILRFIRAI